VISDVQALIENSPSDIEPSFHFYSASRHVERIADHATNIAEDVIYLVDGDIARHRHDGIPY
jgi:phosphate transport system protein